MKVPGGFRVTSGSANNVSEGVVIGNGLGDQFVWIPVPSSESYVKNTSYPADSVTFSDLSGFLPTGVTNEKQTVVNAGGFYIGRYETGDRDNGSLIDNSLTSPVCRNNYNSSLLITQGRAVSEAKKFINNSYAKSALISGTQWDVTMKFVNGKKDGNGAVFDVRTSNSTRGKKPPKYNTGSNIADRVCNIYDLEGNQTEWVAERSSDAKYPFVSRRWRNWLWSW